MSPQERENQLAINAHVSRLKRAMAEAITPEDMKQLAGLVPESGSWRHQGRPIA